MRFFVQNSKTNEFLGFKGPVKEYPDAEKWRTKRMAQLAARDFNVENPDGPVWEVKDREAGD